ALGSFRNADLEAVAATYSSIPDAHNLRGALGPPPAPDPLGSLLAPGPAGPPPRIAGAERVALCGKTDAITARATIHPRTISGARARGSIEGKVGEIAP